MATDVDVQYFSHLNGLILGNNWGDLIRVLDKVLVTGINFTQITAASIDAQGDVHITLFAVHNAMLFQVVELSGFTPNALNQKYRIKGVPNTTQLILKPALDITERSITTTGNGKLASLGYDIIFRDTNDVKRVYRAKNPTAQHPFIRVDESLASPDGSSGVYNSTYAKFAMVGLLEHMDHIDDFDDPNLLQLPFDPSNPSKNWEITGTGTSVVRGWSRWYWARNATPNVSSVAADSSGAPAKDRGFSLCGDNDSFYLLTEHSGVGKVLNGCGLYKGSLQTSTPDWFLMSTLNPVAASQNFYWGNGVGYTPLMRANNNGLFYGLKDALGVLDHITLHPIHFSYSSGVDISFSGTDVAATEIGIYDSDKKLRGNLKHICYAGKSLSSSTVTTTIVADNSMYIADCALTGNSVGGFYFYLGELE